MKRSNVLVLGLVVAVTPVRSDSDLGVLHSSSLWPNATNNNNSYFILLNAAEDNPSFESSQPIRNHLNWQNALILFFFSLIVILSFCGNLLVIRTLVAQRRLRSNSTNLLIGVLSLSDLMMSLFNVPFTILDLILKDWIFGNFICTLVSFVQANSVYLSSFSMAVIAMERHSIIYKFKSQTNSSQAHSSSNVATASTSNRRQTLVSSKSASSRKWCCCCFSTRLCHKNRLDMDSEISMELQSAQQTSPPQAKSKFKISANAKLTLVIFGVFFFAALHSLPHTVFNRVKTIRVVTRVVGSPNETAISPDDNDAQLRVVYMRRCMPVWPKELRNNNFSLFLTIFTTLTQYVIPLSCAGAIYTRIGFTIMSQGKVGEMTRGRAEQLSKKKRKRLLMLILVVGLFALAWLPFNVYYLLLDFGITKTNYIGFLVCLWLAMSSTYFNPFVYCWAWDSFQKEAKLALQQVKSCFTFR